MTSLDRRVWSLLLLVALPVLGMPTGCGGGHQAAAEREGSSLKPLAILYGRYTGQNRGQPPADEAAFRTFIETLSAEERKSLGADDVGELFRSSRDGQPYVVRYGNVAGPPGPAGAPVIAYEQQGIRGRRYVASSLGAVEEVDESRFRELVPESP